VVEISCAVFDIDEGLEWEVHNHFKDYQYIAHTSFSHCDTKHKWRLVIPFTTPVPSHLWEGAWMQCKRFFFEMTGKPMDEKCKDARRFYFVAAGEPIMGSNPKTYCNGLDEYLVHVNYGQCMSIDFQKCENYKAQLEQEQKDKIERMKRRYNAAKSKRKSSLEVIHGFIISRTTRKQDWRKKQWGSQSKNDRLGLSIMWA
jgi:hypothetical protein